MPRIYEKVYEIIYSAHRIFFELYFRERKRNHFENAKHRYIILTILNKINKADVNLTFQSTNLFDYYD